MELASVVLRLLAASQILLFVTVLACSANPARVRLVGCVFFLAVITYFVRPLVLTYLGIDFPLLFEVFPSLIPGFTLVFVWVIFEERSAIPTWILILLAIDIIYSISVPEVHTDVFSPLALAGQLLKVSMAAIAIYVVWRGRENDLIELRLKVRLLFIGCLACTVFGVAIIEVFLIYAVELHGEVLGLAWLFLLSIGTNYGFITQNPSLRLVGADDSIVPIEATDAIKSIEDPVISNLLDRMQNERLYADHDLRVGTLADLIGLPEYQLRKKINQKLGFRNFNQFVNQYRIKEASERLVNEPRTPVLTIGLDVGFRSISSFNTAFQDQFGMSATVYRAQGRTDS